MEIVAPKRALGSPDICVIGWSLLMEWWCIPVDADEDEVATLINGHSSTGDNVQITVEQTKNRLYGGFKCFDEDRRRHVAYMTGQFTYLGENVMLSDEERSDHYKELVEQNKGEAGFIGGGCFLQNAPVVNEPKEEVEDAKV